MNLTSILALKALDGLSARADVISQNIANANTPGYRPLRVSFEEALAGAADGGMTAVEAVEPRIDFDPAQADGVRLDLQMASSSATTARYAALVEILSLQMQQMRTALGA